MKIVAVSGYADEAGLPGATLVGWVTIMALAGFVFWATLHPPHLPRV